MHSRLKMFASLLKIWVTFTIIYQLYKKSAKFSFSADPQEEQLRFVHKHKILNLFICLFMFIYMFKLKQF